MRLTRYEYLLIFFIALGAIIRFWNIGFQEPYTDEIFTLNFVRPQLSFLDVLIGTLTSDFTPPTYYLFAHLSVVLFGHSFEAIRYPSAFFGTLLIPAMYYIGKQYKDELFAVMAAGLTSILYTTIFYSRFARAYSTELFFFAVAFYFYIGVLKGDKRSHWGFAVFALLALWTHLYSVIPIAIMILYLIYTRRADYSIGVIVLGSLPLLTYVYLILSHRIVANGLNGYGASLLELVFLSPFYLLCFSGVIMLPVILYSLWKYRADEVVSVAAVICVVSYVSMIAISFKTPIMVHYTIYLIPMLLLAFILPFYNAIRDNTANVYHGLAVLVIILLEANQIYFFYTVQRWLT